MLDIKFVAKQWFFDGEKVRKALDAGKRAALSKIGAFVRTRAKSITGKRSKQSAAAGAPPKRHAGQLHDLIYFAYDAQRQSVAIGPIPFGKGDAPDVLEFGGTERIVVHTLGGKPRSVTANYAARPFMGPSLRAEVAAGTVSSAWANSVHS